MKATIFTTLLIIFSINNVYSNECPDAHTVLSSGGDFNELGIIFLENNTPDFNISFSVQADNDIVRDSGTRSPNPCDDDWEYISFDTDRAPGDPIPFVLWANDWHRIKITHEWSWDIHTAMVDTIFYFYPPTYEQCPGVPDFVVNIVPHGNLYLLSFHISIEGHDGTCDNYDWEDVLITGDPTGYWSPPPPTNLSSVTLGRKYNLSWSHSWESNVPEVSYVVKKSTGGSSGPYSPVGTTSSLFYTVYSTGWYKVFAKLDGITESTGSNACYAGGIQKPIIETPAKEDTQFETKLISTNVNPYNATTNIKFSLSANLKTQILIYNLNGNLVTELCNEYFSLGCHELFWDSKARNGQRVSSGAYFIILKAGNVVDRQKIMLVR